MHVHFIRNIQFTKVLKADGRQREFNFRKSNGEKESIFTVDVSDDRGNRIIFKMQKDAGSWKIIPQLVPAWIKDNEALFSDIIEEELRNQ